MVSVGNHALSHATGGSDSEAMKSESVCEILTHVVTLYLTTKTDQADSEPVIARAGLHAGVLMLWSNGGRSSKSDEPSPCATDTLELHVVKLYKNVPVYRRLDISSDATLPI